VAERKSKPRKLAPRPPTGAVKVRQKLTAGLVEQRRQQFDAGQDWVLLDAIDLCARTAQPLPMWIVDAFGKRYSDWLTYRAHTLDAAFKVERPRGKHRNTAALHEALRASVVRSVLLLHKPPETAIGLKLFDRAGKSLGIRGAQVRTIWYEPASQPVIKFFRALQRITRPRASGKSTHI
jgi:hypothetical protein